MNGLSTGAPSSVCQTLMPLHSGGILQTSSPPYQVLPSRGQGRVRLILGSPEGNAYQGFMILARDIETGDFVGEFTSLPEYARHVECTAGLKVLLVSNYLFMVYDCLHFTKLWYIKL